MRIALDTDVLIGAYTARGLSADVFHYILVDHELVLSEKVLTEFARIIETKSGVPKKYVSEFLAELTQYHIEPNPVGENLFEVVRDPDDRVVLQSAIAGKAAVLITGDRDLLDVRDDIPQIRIQTPREFWNSIRTGK